MAKNNLARIFLTIEQRSRTADRAEEECRARGTDDSNVEANYWRGHKDALDKLLEHIRPLWPTNDDED